MCESLNCANLTSIGPVKLHAKYYTYIIVSLKSIFCCRHQDFSTDVVECLSREAMKIKFLVYEEMMDNIGTVIQVQ